MPETARDDDRADFGAFERLVVPEIAVLLRVATSITCNPHDAEDLVQDTRLRAYRAIGRFDGRHPRAWLLTILRSAQRNRGDCRPRAALHRAYEPAASCCSCRATSTAKIDELRARARSHASSKTASAAG